jgi:hypothetical protein
MDYKCNAGLRAVTLPSSIFDPVDPSIASEPKILNSTSWGFNEVTNLAALLPTRQRRALVRLRSDHDTT